MLLNSAFRNAEKINNAEARITVDLQIHVFVVPNIAATFGDKYNCFSWYGTFTGVYSSDGKLLIFF